MCTKRPPILTEKKIQRCLCTAKDQMLAAISGQTAING